MSGSRRRFFQDAAILGAGLFGLRESMKAEEPNAWPASDERHQRGATAGSSHHAQRPRVEASSPEPFVPMITPDVGDLPFEMEADVKVFQLVAEPVKKKIAPFKTIDAWGYSGSCPGPTIQVHQGERVRVVFENRLPESTSLHWHGLELPIEQDGVPFISQKPVAPGEKYIYEFTVHQEGTFFYHAHSAMQELMGLVGFFIAHPEKRYKPHANHDYGVVLQEWAVLPETACRIPLRWSSTG